MNEERIESAVQRIEAALARIADVADAGPPAHPVHNASDSMTPSVSALVEKHETLHETVCNTLSELDKLIEELDQ